MCSPGQCGSVGRALRPTKQTSPGPPTGFWSGHVPGLPVWCLADAHRKGNRWVLLPRIDVPPSLLLSLKVNKTSATNKPAERGAQRPGPRWGAQGCGCRDGSSVFKLQVAGRGLFSGRWGRVHFHHAVGCGEKFVLMSISGLIFRSCFFFFFLNVISKKPAGLLLHLLDDLPFPLVSRLTGLCVAGGAPAGPVYFPLHVKQNGQWLWSLSSRVSCERVASCPPWASPRGPVSWLCPSLCPRLSSACTPSPEAPAPPQETGAQAPEDRASKERTLTPHVQPWLWRGAGSARRSRAAGPDCKSGVSWAQMGGGHTPLCQSEPFKKEKNVHDWTGDLLRGLKGTCFPSTYFSFSFAFFRVNMTEEKYLISKNLFGWRAPDRAGGRPVLTHGSPSSRQERVGRATPANRGNGPLSDRTPQQLDLPSGNCAEEALRLGSSRLFTGPEAFCFF